MLLLLFFAASAHAYDFGFLYNTSPNNISAGQLELKFQHRFYGSLARNPIDTFFGLRDGANVLLGSRFSPIQNLDVGTEYIFADAEPSLSVSWAAPTSFAVFTVSAGVRIVLCDEFLELSPYGPGPHQ